MRMSTDEQKAYNEIVILSAKFPSIATRAVMEGVELSLGMMQERLNTKDRMFLSALSLVQTKRLTNELKQHLSNSIINDLGSSLCSMEKEFIKDNRDGQ